MSKRPPKLMRDIEIREKRKLKAKRVKMRSVWQGFGFFGIIGWSVVIPTLLGAFVGKWLDKVYPGGRSWTLVLLVGGLALGCFNAAVWVSKEQRRISSENKQEQKP